MQASKRQRPRPRIAVILAAGRGTRMRSDLPKVLHPVAGRPMLRWVVDAARGAGCERILVVVPPGGPEQLRALGEDGVEGEVLWVVQEEPRGTGHALLQAAETCHRLCEAPADLLVLSGDTPLVTAPTLEGLIAAADGSWGALAVAELEEPGALGRVIARADGTLERIVEATDGSPEELSVRCVNAGVYVFPAPEIFVELSRLGTDNTQGEIYLTDAPGAAAARGERVALYELEDYREAFGVNTRAELARAHRHLLDRHLEALMASGVTILEPARTVVEPGVQVGRDTLIHPDVTLLGRTTVGPGSTLHQGVWVRDSAIGGGVILEPYSVLDGAKVELGCRVGPFARLRPGAHLHDEARVGNFVEVKNSHLGPGSKAGHLAYLGDAVVGAGANIGAGVVTCNFDGYRKHRTVIGEGAFIGSDTMLVAPVTVGARAVTGAGSVISREVPADSLAVERTKQKVVAGWARRRKAGKVGQAADPAEHPDED